MKSTKEKQLFRDLENANLDYETGSDFIIQEFKREESLIDESSTRTRIPIPKMTILTVHNILSLFSEVFLPTGYPSSVKSDYINYQIYDSLQAFFSSIASLFANRAVLSAVGVGDESATSTSALFMKIVQETIGRLGTIIFAWKFGSYLEPECKKYRFLADIVNDSAMVFDCFSPFFPFNKTLTVSLLCMSGLLRAICGVMAGGSRAALTLHFTHPEYGSIADVNAKDQSQETVISLMGMIVGSAIVAIIPDNSGFMWIVLFFLLSIHIYTNYQAVRNVVMETLNRQRTNIIFAHLIHSVEIIDNSDFEIIKSRAILSPEAVSQREIILEIDGCIRNRLGSVIGRGMFTEFSILRKFALEMNIKSTEFINITRRHGYSIFFTNSSTIPQVAITLIEDEDSVLGRSAGLLESRANNIRNGISDLRAWVHAYLICEHLFRSPSSDPLEVIASTEKTLNYLFDTLDICESLVSAGWNLSPRCIISYPVEKIMISHYS